ncbi:MAG TPA: helix-turn-helix domain-containing protein [Pirellulales bacterium]|jgi:hypothetical protein|nr:helix-turn-helix domain-containing protein [Pirellulales bacterium]
MRIELDDTVLTQLIELVVVATLERVEQQRRHHGDRLAYTEPEAAALVGVKPHVLRDARLRGELSGKRVGKRTVYSRDELLRYLNETTTNGRTPARR